MPRRKILFVTTDQQRYDTLGCNGGTLARTPVIDGLAARGIRYERAHPQSVVCMPSRATMLTGQYPTTHGVWMNGVPLPIDAPSVAEVLRVAGYRTALVGKAHFEPFLDPFLRFVENAQSRLGSEPPGGSHRGFEHLELATHGSIGPLHYARWLAKEHPEAVGGFYRAIDASLRVTDEVDVVFTSDHGELQGDFGFLFKGRYHVDALLRIPLIWRPAPSTGRKASVVKKPVGLIDLAPTFCHIAGIDPPEWMHGQQLPTGDADAEARGLGRVFTEWDSELFGVGVHLRTVFRDDVVCTIYGPGAVHDGTEGELYSTTEDPHQFVNRWGDPAWRSRRDELLDDLHGHRPPVHEPRLVLEAPV
jgi:arylsulfatase A-like enzyme